MTDYKLVPVEPIRRAMVALERFANDTLAGRNSAHELRELLAAEPAVQGEPVGYVSQDFLDGKWTLDHIAKSDEGQISRTIPVFAKPPQPAPDVSALVAALESAMDYIPLGVVRCHGGKCRELWCATCFGDEQAESYRATAVRHFKNAESALAAHRKGE